MPYFARLGLILVATALVTGFSANQNQSGALELLGPGTISKADTYESFGSPSPDGLEFYFTQHQPNFGQHHIFVSRLTGGRWTAPESVSFSTTWNDREPRLSPDGRRIYFSSNRPMTAGDKPGRLDLFMAERN